MPPRTVSRMHSAADGGTFFEASEFPIVSTSMESKRNSAFPILARRFEYIHNVNMNYMHHANVYPFQPVVNVDIERLADTVAKRVESIVDEKITDIVAKLVEDKVAKRVESIFDEKIEPVNIAIKNLSEEVTGLRSDLRKSDGTLAKQASNKFTVELMGKGEDEKDFLIFGHGTLLKDRISQFGVILTAAHTALDAKKYHSVGRFQKIRFLNGEEYEVADIDTFQLQLFLDDNYIIDGTRDYAGVRLKFKETPPSVFQDLQISQAHPFESEFYGRTSNVNFRANAVTIVKAARVRVSAPSINGCSGTPLFSTSGQILSVLHGETKHRAKLHSRNLDSDENSVPIDNSDPEGMSTHVYVDILKNVGCLKLWGHDFFPYLYKLDFLDEEMTNDPSQKLYKSPGNVGVTASKEAMEFYEMVKILVHPKVAEKLDVFKRDYFTFGELCNFLVLHNRRMDLRDDLFRYHESKKMELFTIAKLTPREVCNALSRYYAEDEIRNALARYHAREQRCFNSEVFTLMEVCDNMPVRPHGKKCICDLLLRAKANSNPKLLAHFLDYEGDLKYKAYAASL